VWTEAMTTECSQSSLPSSSSQQLCAS